MRCTFDFPEDVEERIDVLMAKANVENLGELITRALTLYEWAVEERELGNDIGSIMPDETATVVVGF